MMKIRQSLQIILKSFVVKWLILILSHFSSVYNKSIYSNNYYGYLLLKLKLSKTK